MDESFGHYQLRELIGGEVYRALDTTTDRVVALKLLSVDDPEFDERFRRDAQIAAGLTDPHLIPIHGYGDIDRRLYLDMQLIDGRDLGAVLDEATEPLSPATAVSYVEQLADALDAAHSAGLVLRDITPSRILVTPNGSVYLSNSGIGREADDDAGSGRPDVYALAGVFRQCLAGNAVLVDETAKPPAGLGAVIDKALANDPSERYQSAQDFASAARRALPRTARLRAAIRRRDKHVPAEQKPLDITKPASEPAGATASAGTRTAVKPKTVDHSDHGTYWNSLWVVLLIAAAALALIVVGIV